jgi:hypothetical protein
VQETIKGFPIISDYTPMRDCGVVARIILVDREVDGGLGRFVVAWQDTCDTPTGGWQPRWRQPRYCHTLAESRNEFMKRAAVADGTVVRTQQEGGRMTMQDDYFSRLGLGPVTTEKHYCTGCGVPATKQCVDCGEWRCGVHLHVIGKWCASTEYDRKRGEWCARSRHRVVGGRSQICDAVGARAHGVPCDCGAPRLVRFARPGSDQPERYEDHAVWRCAAHLEYSAAGSWRWREETERDSKLECEASVCSMGTHRGQVRALWLRRDRSNAWEKPKRCCEQALELYRRLNPELEWSVHEPSSAPASGVPEPLTAAQLEEMVREASGDFKRVGGPHMTMLVPRSEAKLPDPAKVPAKSGTLHSSDHTHLRSEPKSLIYCSSAPPRELVESAVVRCGTGLEGGEPVMGPLIWSWPRRREWDRHVAFAPDGLGTYEGEGRIRWARGTTIADHDETIDLGSDAFGGRSLGVRCRLCGGWIRSVEVPA